MKWALLFGGIGLGAVVLYGLLGLWLWRRAKALFGEVDEAVRRSEQSLTGEASGQVWPAENEATSEAGRPT